MICQKQHRQNEPAGQVDIPTRVDIHVMGDPDMCRDHRCLTTCQKQHRQNRTSGGGEIDRDNRHSQSTRVESPGCDGGSQTCVGTTDVSLPVKNNTDRMTQLVR